MLTLLLGPDWISNRNEILSRIKTDVAAEQIECILMVPELISHDTERRLCTVAGDTASRFAEVLTFSRLAQRVGEAVGCGVLPCLDNGGRLVAMASAARQLHGKLKAYAAVESKPEFLSGLIEAVDEFKRCCISSRDLMAAAKQTSGALAQKLEELSLLLDAYDAICDQGLRDPRDQMTWLLEQLEESDFAQNHTFYIDGFPDFTRQHMAILEHMIRHAPHVCISMNCDSVDTTDPAFEKAAQTAGELFRFAKREGIQVNICPVPGRNDDLLPVRRGIFQSYSKDNRIPANRLQLKRAKSVQDECLIAAERIMELVRTGARYRDISVVCADIALYQNAIDSVFRRCHIPSYRSGTDDILDKSVIVTVLSAIDTAIGGFEQSDVIRYMKSILSPLDIHACDQIENYAIMWGIYGRAWESEWCNHPRGLSDHWNDHDRAYLSALNQNKELVIKPLSRLRQGLCQAHNVKEQVLALYEFLNEISFPQRLASMAEKMDAEGDNRNAQILCQLWEILLNSMEQLHDVLGHTMWDTENFSRLFRLLLSQYDVGTIPPKLDAVTVGPVSAMRCQQCRHLLVLGAAEGCLPGYGGSRGVLTDQERTALKDLGVPLTGGALEGVQAEFAEIHGVFCAATDTVSVSYPGGQPSSIYRRLLAMGAAEYTPDTSLIAARADRSEAAAYLVRANAPEIAETLRISELYNAFDRKARYQPGQMSGETVKSLYGEKLNLSASQIDKQALCRMAYFLRYGLQAKERKPLTVDPAEFGTFVHAVLELTAQDVMASGGFHEVSLEQTMEFAQLHAQKYAQTHFKQLDSDRLSYLFSRNNQELFFVVKELWEELRQSNFVPVGFEVGFGDGEQIPPIQIPAAKLDAQLRGFVDRVDIWTTEGRTYFRVVDYKTGSKDFDYCDIYNGLGLQMLLYLFALEDKGICLLGENAYAAGVQYFPARAPFILVDGMEDTELISSSREKAWKRKGLLLQDETVLQAMDTSGTLSRFSCSVRKDGTLTGDVADSEQFKLLRAYVFSLLGKIVDEIAGGNVDPNPYTRGSSDNACRFCPYAAVCHPANLDGRRNYKTITARKFWEDIAKEVEKGG